METKRERGRPHGTSAPKSDAVARFRARTGMTQEELAHELNCSIATVRRYEQKSIMPGGKAIRAALDKLARPYRFDLEAEPSEPTT